MYPQRCELEGVEIVSLGAGQVRLPGANSDIHSTLTGLHFFGGFPNTKVMSQCPDFSSTQGF